MSSTSHLSSSQPRSPQDNHTSGPHLTSLHIEPFQFSAPNLLALIHTLIYVGVEPSLRPLPHNPIPSQSTETFVKFITNSFNSIFTKINVIILCDSLDDVFTLPHLIDPIITHLQTKTKQRFLKNITDRTVRRRLDMHIKFRIKHSVQALISLKTYLTEYGIRNPSTSLSTEFKNTFYSLAHLANINRSVAGNFDT